MRTKSESNIGTLVAEIQWDEIHLKSSDFIIFNHADSFNFELILPAIFPLEVFTHALPPSDGNVIYLGGIGLQFEIRNERQNFIDD